MGSMMRNNHDDGLIWTTLHNKGKDYSFMMAELRVRPRNFRPIQRDASKSSKTMKIRLVEQTNLYKLLHIYKNLIQHRGHKFILIRSFINIMLLSLEELIYNSKKRINLITLDNK